MKRLSIMGLIFACVILAITGCATKCDDFNISIVDWMPYKTGDRIVIAQNSISDTLMVTYSEIYHTDKIGFGIKCACTNSFILNLSSDSLNLDIRFNESMYIALSEIVINDEWMDYSGQLDSAIVKGKVYNDVLIYQQINPPASARFERIMVSRSIGIIAIIGKSEEWVIVDDSEKQIITGDIPIQGTDC